LEVLSRLGKAWRDWADLNRHFPVAALESTLRLPLSRRTGDGDLSLSSKPFAAKSARRFGGRLIDPHRISCGHNSYESFRKKLVGEIREIKV
jgi:hypothetical protein